MKANLDKENKKANKLMKVSMYLISIRKCTGSRRNIFTYSL